MVGLMVIDAALNKLNKLPNVIATMKESENFKESIGLIQTEFDKFKIKRENMEATVK